MVKTQVHVSVKPLRTDNAREYVSSEIVAYLQGCSIELQNSCAYPENGQNNQYITVFLLSSPTCKLTHPDRSMGSNQNQVMEPTKYAFKFGKKTPCNKIFI